MLTIQLIMPRLVPFALKLAFVSSVSSAGIWHIWTQATAAGLVQTQIQLQLCDPPCDHMKSHQPTNAARSSREDAARYGA